jgi:hypothetical protein
VIKCFALSFIILFCILSKEDSYNNSLYDFSIVFCCCGISIGSDFFLDGFLTITSSSSVSSSVSDFSTYLITFLITFFFFSSGLTSGLTSGFT